MPNECVNRLTVIGKPEGLEEFMNAVEAVEPLSFERLLPVPQELEAEESPLSWDSRKLEQLLTEEEQDRWREWQALLGKCDYSNSYLWRLVKWGTKWDAYGVAVSGVQQLAILGSAGPTSIVRYGFETAWNPPIFVITEASKRFPLLVFRLDYVEQQNDRAGKVVFSGGKKVVIEQEDSMNCRRPTNAGRGPGIVLSLAEVVDAG